MVKLGFMLRNTHVYYTIIIKLVFMIAFDFTEPNYPLSGFLRVKAHLFALPKLYSLHSIILQKLYLIKRIRR